MQLNQKLLMRYNNYIITSITTYDNLITIIIINIIFIHIAEHYYYNH